MTEQRDYLIDEDVLLTVDPYDVASAPLCACGAYIAPTVHDDGSGEYLRCHDDGSRHYARGERFEVLA